MPRSNRPRRPRPGDDGSDEEDLGRLLSGWRRTEVRRGRSWNVQPVGIGRSEKEYRCPGCGNLIEPGIAHLVVWRADGVLGDERDLADRRHWHNACWKVA